jgi:pimeloyl-ACP methyl ester carboxylesterase
MVCLHGFTDTWRTWELVLPMLERHHEVLAPTLAGHAGGPPVGPGADEDLLADEVERAMDAAGIETAHLVGNSLGGYLALRLAARGRAETVVALAPAGGWAVADPSYADLLSLYAMLNEYVRTIAPFAHEIVSTREGRRRSTGYVASNFEHIPAELVAHLIRGAAGCQGVSILAEHAGRRGWELDAERIACPVRVLWGTDDRLLQWPAAAVRYRTEWLPQADWIELPGVGHCPQLDSPAETAALILSFTNGAGVR